MTYSRTHSVVAAILVVIALSASSHSQPNQWNLEVELAKDQYVLHEPVWLNVTLTNIAADTQRTYGLRFPNHHEFSIELRDSLGDPMEYTGWHADMAAGPGDLLLEPGEEDFGSFDLNRLFGLFKDGLGFDMAYRFPFLPVGSYTIQVYFEDAISEELTFSVTEPSGEARAALDMIEQASSIWRQDNPGPSAQMYGEVVERSPNGPFAETCFYLSVFHSPEIRTSRLQGTYDRSQLKRAMLERYPNSGDAPDWIRAVTSKMDEQAKRDFLSELAEAHPNTRAAKYARVVQDRMNQQKAGE